MIDLKRHIRQIPDHPKPGILFYDIGTLLAHPQAFGETVRRLGDLIKPLQVSACAAIESRGFVFGAPAAVASETGLVMIRKKGKLPGDTLTRVYDLEYGTDTLEIQAGHLKPGDRVVLVDDVLATGGTAAAAIDLIRQTGAEVVHAFFVMELDFLNGRTRLNVPVSSLVRYAS